MKRKLVGILVVTLLITTVALPAVGFLNSGRTAARESSANTDMLSDTFKRLQLPPWLLILINGDWNYWDNQPNLYVIPTGNVGIGTDNPQAKLDVAGTVMADAFVGAKLDVAGTVMADAFVGDGSGLTNIDTNEIAGNEIAGTVESNSKGVVLYKNLADSVLTIHVWVANHCSGDATVKVCDCGNNEKMRVVIPAGSEPVITFGDIAPNWQIQLDSGSCPGECLYDITGCSCCWSRTGKVKCGADEELLYQNFKKGDVTAEVLVHANCIKWDSEVYLKVKDKQGNYVIQKTIEIKSGKSLLFSLSVPEDGKIELKCGFPNEKINCEYKIKLK